MQRFTCDLCHADRPIRPKEAAGSGMVSCGRCGFLYRLKRPVGQELDKLYGNEWYFTGRYKSGNEKVTSDYLRDKPNIMVFVRRRYETIARYKKRGRLLDIGAAMGFYLEYFKQQGWDVAGIEYSPYAAKYAMEELGIKDIFIGDVDRASYPKNSFDVVTLWLIIEHLVRPRASLKRIWHWLKPGGIIGIKTPNASGLTATLNPKQWFEQHPDDHNVDYSIESMKQMLEETGYEILEQETEGIYLDRAYRALHLRLPKAAKTRKELEKFYGNLAWDLNLGDSLVMFARKKR